MDIWTIVIVGGIITAILLAYSHMHPRKDLPLRLEPKGNPVVRLGTPPNTVDYELDEVIKCVGYGSKNYGLPIILKLREPLLRSFGNYRAGERLIAVDDRMVSARTVDGDPVTSFEEKYNGDTILRVHKDYFERDLEDSSTGEIKRLIQENDEKTRRLLVLESKLASLGTIEGRIEEVNKLTKKIDELKRTEYHTRHHQSSYEDRFDTD